MRERFLIGRVIGNLMRNDVINKLSRHEAHLMRQVEKTLAQLRALRAERAETDVEEDPKQAAAGYVGRFEGEAAATDVMMDDSFVAEADVNAQFMSQIQQTRAELHRLWAERPDLCLPGEPGEIEEPHAMAEEPTEKGPEKQGSRARSVSGQKGFIADSQRDVAQADLSSTDGAWSRAQGNAGGHSPRTMRRRSHE